MPAKYQSQLLGATVYPDEEIIFFYHGFMSQWAQAVFHCNLINEDVNCAEQAMMLFKAKLFGDSEIYQAILNTSNPREQKALGRQVKGYNETQWKVVRLDAVTQINFDKFDQCKAWGELLMLTDPYELVEASPVDRIWGIGMGEDNPVLLQRLLWGENLLGVALTRVRDQIIRKL